MSRSLGSSALTYGVSKNLTADGEQELDSDIDILIDFEEYPSLLEFVGIEDELSKALGIKVDLVMKSGLKPRLGRRILQEIIYL